MIVVDDGIAIDIDGEAVLVIEEENVESALPIEPALTEDAAE